MPVFSHDELLVTVTQQSNSIKTALWFVASYRSDRQGYATTDIIPTLG